LEFWFIKKIKKVKKNIKKRLTLLYYCSIIIPRKEKEMRNDIKILNMQMPKELYEQLQELAKKKNISLASLVKLITTEYLEKLEK
jgi:predicted HicB family RNase H-like nuclease